MQKRKRMAKKSPSKVASLVYSTRGIKNAIKDILQEQKPAVLTMLLVLFMFVTPTQAQTNPPLSYTFQEHFTVTNFNNFLDGVEKKGTDDNIVYHTTAKFSFLPGKIIVTGPNMNMFITILDYEQIKLDNGNSILRYKGLEKDSDELVNVFFLGSAAYIVYSDESAFIFKNLKETTSKSRK